MSFCRIGIFHCFATKAHLSYAVLTAGASGVVVKDAGAANTQHKYTTINHHQLVTHVQIHNNQPSPINQAATQRRLPHHRDDNDVDVGGGRRQRG